MLKILFAFSIAFLVTLALIGVTVWLVRQFRADRLRGRAEPGRQPRRLAVIDAARIDGRRRLMLIRRDNVEHLLMIGGAADVVIEPNIVRAVGAREPGRPPAPEPDRLAAELSNPRLPPPQMPAPPWRSAASRAEPLASPQISRNLAELTRQLEVALSRPQVPQGRASVTDPLATPPSASPTVTQPNALVHEFEPRGKPRFNAQIEPKRNLMLEPEFEPPKPEGKSKLEPELEPNAQQQQEPERQPEPESEPKTDA